MHCSSTRVLGFAFFAIACSSAEHEPSTVGTSRNALTISESPMCMVALTKLSYDDPEADDEEFIELTVTRNPASSAGLPPGDGSLHPTSASEVIGSCHADAGTPIADAGVGAAEDAGALSLADCGLDRLELLNGGSDGCPIYRTIQLAQVRVPPGGTVLICAAASPLSTLYGCDVSTTGSSALSNGWLQNGPGDALRVVSAGMTTLLGYESVPTACGAPSAELAVETGEAFGAADDVNTFCGSFVLSPRDQAEPRTPNACSSPSVDGSVEVAAPPVTPSTAGTSGSATSLGNATQTVFTGAPPAPPVERLPEGGLTTSDGGESTERPTPPPAGPGCSVPPQRSAPRGLGFVAVLLAALARRVRLRRRAWRALRPFLRGPTSCVRSDSERSR